VHHVLATHAGGLGDNLIYSTLPKRYYEQGDTVRVYRGPSVINSEEPAWRNEGIRELVWDANPFVSGYTTDAPTIGLGMFLGSRPFVYFAKRMSPIASVETSHGFVPANDVPAVYGVKRLVKKWAGRILCDPRSSGQPFPAHLIERFVRWVGHFWGFSMNEVEVLESPNSGRHGASALSKCARACVANIHEYAEAVASCRIFLSTESGGASLASAVRKCLSFALATTRSANDAIFIHPNVKYFFVGDGRDDFHANMGP
jgi:hypothetical protein